MAGSHAIYWHTAERRPRAGTDDGRLERDLVPLVVACDLRLTAVHLRALKVGVQELLGFRVQDELSCACGVNSYCALPLQGHGKMQLQREKTEFF